MKPAARLALFGMILAAVFAVAAVMASTLVSDDTVDDWRQETAHDGHDMTGAGAHGDHAAGTSAAGLGLEQDGFRLTAVDAPGTVDTEGPLSLVITGPGGDPVTDFDLGHEKELHLIVVRADGRHFRHAHPVRDADGTWSIPWRWAAAGTYRVFADFVPAQTGAGMTLSSTVQVAGRYVPVAAAPAARASVAGYDVAVEGALVAGEPSPLTMQITRNGRPVTTLQPYLGAFGHLVALREGDLAFLHVHPDGGAPEPGQTSGPEIVFEATAPTAGRYLLYLDFQVDGRVHTAPFVIDAAAPQDSGSAGNDPGAG